MKVYKAEYKDRNGKKHKAAKWYLDYSGKKKEILKDDQRQKKQPEHSKKGYSGLKSNSPKGIRTPVAGLKTRCPRPA